MYIPFRFLVQRVVHAATGAVDFELCTFHSVANRYLLRTLLSIHLPVGMPRGSRVPRRGMPPKKVPVSQVAGDVQQATLRSMVTEDSRARGAGC